MAHPPPSRESDRDFIARSARWGIVAGLAAAAFFALLWVLKAALTPLAGAFVIAYLLDPVIDRFERRGVRRSIAIFLLLALSAAALGGFLLFVMPKLQREIAALTERMPGYLDQLNTAVIPGIEQRFHVQLPHTLDDLIARVRSGDIPLPLEELRKLLEGAFRYVTGTLSAAVGLIVIPILAYYLLVEFDDLVARAARYIPPRSLPYVTEKAQTVNRLVSGFLHGQLVVAATLGFLYATGFSVIGIDLAIGVGVLAGVLALVPYLGSAVALATASILCVLKFGLDGHLLAVFAWYALCQTLEGFVLTPRIVGHSVGLHPAVVIVALLIFGDLFGFLGLLIAVPGAAVVKVFAEEALDAYRRSSLFGGS
ncbi:MAG TPA: AI-2E family transporter [Myxococcota bacterium]|nr:AI-2E family transporter [Myxococcota bacterium]